MTGQVLAPTVSASAGIHKPNVELALTSATGGASIYYTLDGSNPTTSWTLYTYPISLLNTAQTPTTVRAIAAESGDDTSLVSTATYTFDTQGTASTTALSSSANPSALDQSVTFITTVSGASGQTPSCLLVNHYIEHRRRRWIICL